MSFTVFLWWFIFEKVTADWDMLTRYLIGWSYYNQLFLIVPYQFSYYFCFLIYSWYRLFDHYLKQIIPNVSGVTFIEEGKLIWINRSILRQVTFMGIFSIFNLIVRLDTCIITIGFFYTLYYLFIKFIYWVYLAKVSGLSIKYPTSPHPRQAQNSNTMAT